MDSSEQGAPVSENRDVCRFLNRWIHAWEKEKIDTYMDCYSKSFFSQKMNWQQWKDHKQEINDSNKMIRVTVEKPEIVINGNKATVSFIQKYVSDTYTDYGLKRLSLRKENQQWKIIKEGWEAI